MKKFNHSSIRSFGAGVLVAAVIAGSGLPAHALSALRQINVSMGGYLPLCGRQAAGAHRRQRQ